MPWCPDCKNEYRDGFRICSDCGGWLVATLEEEEPDERVEMEYAPRRLLVRLPDRHDAERIAMLLTDEKIRSFLAFYDNTDPAQAAIARFGGDTAIYVAEQELERARQIVESLSFTEDGQLVYEEIDPEYFELSAEEEIDWEDMLLERQQKDSELEWKFGGIVVAVMAAILWMLIAARMR